jgi:hypothetical protein
VVEGSEFEVRVTWKMKLKLWKEYVISCLDISMLYRGVIKLRIFFGLRSADVSHVYVSWYTLHVAFAKTRRRHRCSTKLYRLRL